MSAAIVAILLSMLGSVLGSVISWLLGLQSRGEKPSPAQAARLAKIFSDMNKARMLGESMGVYAADD